MKDIKQLAEKIATDFQLSIKQRTDALLKLDCEMYTNLGIDSLKKEKQEVKKNSKHIYKQIKGIDEVSGSMLLDCLDD
jgi:hypothetical protein